MARMPGAAWTGEHSPGRAMSHYDIVCIHTIVGHAPAHAAHFSTHDDGRIVQSRDTRYRSAANLDGNHRVIAIENEDGARDVPLTDAQITACAKILAWAHKVHGVPLQLAPNSKPGSRGLAYHRQGVDGNFASYDYPGRVSGGEKWSSVYGKTCPRDKRIAQLPEILLRAKLLVNPPPPPAPTLKVMTWNVKTNRSWTGAVLPELLPILETHKPDVVCLQECYDAPDLVGKVPGYTFRYQGHDYPPKTAGYIEERGNQIILVRDGVEVKISAALEMAEDWKGPNLGLMHDPRVHRRVTVLKGGVIWRVIDFHAPPPLSSGFNNDAIAESNAAMLHCLKTFPQDEPIIIVGDFNQSNSTVVTRIGAPGEAVVDGGGIDLAVYKNCRKVKGENLGNFGSDHPVKIWTLSA